MFPLKDKDDEKEQSNKEEWHHHLAIQLAKGQKKKYDREDSKRRKRGALIYTTHTLSVRMPLADNGKVWILIQGRYAVLPRGIDITRPCAGSGIPCRPR